MNSTTNTLAKKYSAKAFFRFNFRQNIHHLLLYLIVVTLVMIMPSVIMINDYYDTVTFYDKTNSRIANCVANLGGIGVIVSGCIAVLAGMSTITYVNSKQNIGCYHSFPIKRETMYLTESLTRTLYWLITMLFGYSVSYIIMLAALPTDIVLDNFSIFMKLVFVAMLAFMLIYAVFLFAAGLTGTAFMRLIMVCAVFFLPIIVYSIFVMMFCKANDNLHETYYFSDEVMQYLCSPVRAYMGTMELLEEGKCLKLLLVIPESVAFYVGGIILHKFRKTELAGTTIIWKPVWNVLKYTVVASCTLFCAYIFEAIDGGSLSFMIGALVGAVLSLILTNTLFYRSSKAMFKGIKPFAVCCALMLVFILIVPFNVTGKIGQLYSAGNTRELTLEIGNLDADLTFDNPDDIAHILAMLEDDNAMYSGAIIPEYRMLDPKDDPDYELLDDGFLATAYEDYYKMSAEEFKKCYDTQSANYFGATQYRITLTQKPKFGIPLCLGLGADANSTFSSEIVRTKQYSDIMDVSSWMDFDSITEIAFKIDNRNLSITKGAMQTDDTSRCYYYNRNISYEKDIVGMFEKAVSVLSLTGFDESIHENSPIIGCIDVYYNYNKNSFHYPIYAENLEMMNAVSELFFVFKETNEEWKPYKTADEYYSESLEYIEGTNNLILLVNCETGETKKLTTDEFVKLGKYTTSFVTEDTWRWYYLDRKSENKYMIIYQLDEYYDLTINFRLNAVTDEELDDIFVK